MRISEKIYLELQKDILQGKYRPNSRFPSERELAVTYDSSRSAVREAMAKLSQAGLVKTVPQSGTYVTDYPAEASLDLLIQIMKATEAIDTDILISLLKYRRMAEPYIAREAALKASAKDVKSLKSAGDKLIDQLENDAGDIMGAIDLDFAFHLEVARATRNLIFQLLFNSFKPIYQFCADAYYQSPGTPGVTIDFVKNLTAAIEDGDGERAYAVMMEAVIFAEHQLQPLTVP
ncbi:MAG: FadR/GntR family transcriptional regulator [Desulfobacterales bacterium]